MNYFPISHKGIIKHIIYKLKCSICYFLKAHRRKNTKLENSIVAVNFNETLTSVARLRIILNTRIFHFQSKDYTR